MTHTPGPWRANTGPACGGGRYFTVTTIPPGPALPAAKKILELPYGSNHSPEDEANARLIAAAPDLLEVGIIIMDMLEVVMPDTFFQSDLRVNLLRKVIEKAEGTDA